MPNLNILKYHQIVNWIFNEEKNKINEWEKAWSSWVPWRNTCRASWV